VTDLEHALEFGVERGLVVEGVAAPVEGMASRSLETPLASVSGSGHV
jgi:hypothetical protein